MSLRHGVMVADDKVSAAGADIAAFHDVFAVADNSDDSRSSLFLIAPQFYKTIFSQLGSAVGRNPG